MATVSNAQSDLPLEQLALYHASDPYLSSFLIFYGPVATTNATVSSSRIQAHILTPAGFQSYPRITISPAAPLYAAVNHLPREKQGDEVCRALAVSMLKYFADMSDPTKQCLMELIRAGRPGAKVPKMFDEMHAADLANRMTLVENKSGIVRDIRSAFQERRVPCIDLDVVLPAGTIQSSQQPGSDNGDFDEGPGLHYGPYSPLIQTLGSPIFLPTSRLKRAPSQPTNVSKSRVFSRSQKEAVRMNMCELVDTEERYVAKIYSLVHDVAEEFRLKAQEIHPSSISPDESSLNALFPACLNEILDTNMGFLGIIRRVIEETEFDAIADIADDTELPPMISPRVSPRERQDPIGVVVFARTLHEWFPRFSQPYADYMRAHTGFTQTLNSFMKDKNSSFSKRVHETGEQALRSLLMEPVQRLPRYSLLIDTIMGSLPLVHPAVRPFLKARDIINEICALDGPSSTDHGQGFKRLREIANGWPTTITPAGRLISAVDVNEVPPPYHIDNEDLSSSKGMMLIYKNCLVLLSKPAESRVTARGLLAELDSAASNTNDFSVSISPTEVRVAQVIDLHAVRCTQSACGRILFLVPASANGYGTDQTTIADFLALELTGMYEGRANKLVEEIVKAGIEGRFSDKERESDKWTLRSPTGTVGNVGMLACVFEGAEGAVMNHIRSSRIRVIFDTPKAVCNQILNSSNLEVIVSVSRSIEDQYRVDIDSIVGSATSDIVTTDSFIPVLSKRLLNLLSPLHGPQNRSITLPIIHSNFEIIRYFATAFLTQVKVPRVFRPPSPTKLLSSLLGSGQPKGAAANTTPPNSAALLGEFPKMPPPRANLTRSNTLPSSFSGREDTPSKISVVGSPSSKGTDNDFGRLEQTLAAYVLALQSRSGNVVGRTLRGRGGVDQSLVNELYNVLLEDPARIQAAAEVSVDTLFVAFETFMANAWRTSMGPVLETSSLALIQSQYDAMYPREFDESFRKFLAEMSPQNRRALAAMVRLLSELLDASGNDGDRGALTAAFAEVLTMEGDPMRYISLLDRLVDDFDNLFDEYIPGGASLEGTLNCDQTKQASQNPGSMGSNSSSFRKRFGFGLHRDGAKNDGESKVSSILRTLSKSKGPGDSEPGTPKGSILRSKSIDVDAGMGGPDLRPGSGDRPTTASSEEYTSQGNAHGQPPSLSSIQGITRGGTVKMRRKRRSSLSDLRPATSSTDSSGISPTQPLRPATPSHRPRSEMGSPARQIRPPTNYGLASPVRSSSPAKDVSPSRLSPIRRSPTRPTSPSRKENIDPRSTQVEGPAPRKNSDETGSPTRHSRRTRGTGIPTSRGTGLRERPTLMNSFDPKRPESSSPQKTQKLRMQSPQKLRDRLQTEKKAQSTAQQGLKNELDELGDEMRALKLGPTQHSLIPVSESHDAAQASNSALLSRIRSLESRFENLNGEFSGRTHAIEKDLESSLVVSEKRAKKLDELYREASAENEALYDRFNTELSKIANDARLGSADEALKSHLSEALDEMGRLKKENFRLKREAGGLRAQQAAIALLKASE